MYYKKKSSQDILKDRYKDTISSFLRDNKLYDCLAHNNQMIIIDQSFSCFDVVNIFQQQSIDEVIFWSAEISNYDKMFTHTDIIKVVLRFYKNAVENVPIYSMKTPHNLEQIEEEGEIFEEATQISNPSNFSVGHIMTPTQLQKLEDDMKRVTIKNWFRNFAPDTTTLIKGKMDEKLHDAIRKLILSNVHRILVVDQEKNQVGTKMLVGTIQQRDILVFLIKGFSQYFSENLIINPHINDKETSEQHKLQIGYFFKPRDMHSSLDLNAEKRLMISIHCSQSVFQSFHDLVYLHKRTSIPIVDFNQKYIGILHRRDFLFILRENNYDWLSQTVESFFHFIREEKKKYNIYQILTKELFTMTQTVKEVVENLVLSECCFLVCLNDDNTVSEQLSIQDIFNFFLCEE